MGEERHAKKLRGANGELRILPKRTRCLSEEQDNDGLNPKTPCGPEGLEDIGVIELIEQDSRPTFIIDLHGALPVTAERMNVVFCNKSLRFFDELRKLVMAPTFYPAYPEPMSPATSSSSSTPPAIGMKAALEAEFREWATSLTGFDPEDDGYMPRHTFRGMYWTCVTLKNRWRVISASQVPNQRRQSHGTPKSSSRSTSRSTSRTRESMDPDEMDLEQQLADSMSKFRVLTELNPVGMYYLSPEGNIVYANDMWYEITGHPRGLEGEMSFMNVISESDHPLITKEWEILVTQKGKRTFELRLRNPSYDDHGNPRQKWILASCDQEFDENGTLISIMGCITDISIQKQAQEDALAKVYLTKQLDASERNFKQMAELAPCGMFTFDLEGAITWANSQWYEMTGHPRNAEDHSPMSILQCIEPRDHEAFRMEWQQLILSKEEISTELRLKKPWIRQERNESVNDTTWILFLALPQLDESGNLTKVLGCTTDISHFKWAEYVQMQSRIQAEEAKRQQENFIDMTSHEMRNPLSAMLMCADGIADSLKDFLALKEKTEIISEELVESNLDAAQTIVLCAQHQKRIIDDVLTLSKLKSAMLHVTPVQVQVEDTVRRTLRMFESELLGHDIRMTFVVEPSYENANIDMVYCDPVRLTQIFINLLTNAIKFTQSEGHREITINLGASVSKPPKDAAPDIQWFPSKDSHDVQDLTLTPEWGTGEQIYLYFAVKDTGRGLDEEEKTRLFHRFSQASPRTHVQYGGSGLGLFISRELTELQGGEIGVASTAGVGSTFAFYIKARRSITTPGEYNGISRPFSESTFPRSSSISSIPTIRTRYNYHILLVEDNLINQKVLSKQLRNGGCTVHVANHGIEALDFLSRTIFWTRNVREDGEAKGMKLSVILMDLEMPIMDGLTCTRRIRDLEREGKVRGHVPCIAVTANTRSEQMDAAIEAGMDDIVPKPFQIPELMQKIEHLVAHKHS